MPRKKHQTPVLTPQDVHDRIAVLRDGLEFLVHEIAAQVGDDAPDAGHLMDRLWDAKVTLEILVGERRQDDGIDALLIHALEPASVQRARREEMKAKLAANPDLAMLVAVLKGHGA
jgi:hypothetical protein